MKNPFRRPDAAGASFLPEDYVARKNETRANIFALVLFAIVMFGVVGAFFVTNRQWLSVRREHEAMNAQYAQEAKKIEQLKGLEAQKSDMLAKAEITTALIERVPRSILLAELVTRMPKEITLLDLSLEGKRIEPPKADPKDRAGAKPGAKPITKAVAGSLTKAGGKGEDKAKEEKPTPPRLSHTLKLQGVASANWHITDYLASLTACPLLQTVELTYIKERTIKDVSLREFEITAQLKPDADARAIEPVTTLRQGSHASAGGDSDRGAAATDAEGK